MTIPKQNRGKSEQVVQTPIEFLNAVDAMFGEIEIDLAALESNRATPKYFGPDHENPGRRDALACMWPPRIRCWLNPPFANIAPWAKRAAEHGLRNMPGSHVMMLVPASVGANWYRDWVQPYADVYSVGRMKFVGHEDPYPKDLILAHFWKLGGYKFRHWKWQS